MSRAANLAARCGLAAADLTASRQPVLDNDEELRGTFDSVALLLGSGREDQGVGRLFVTNRKIVWASLGGMCAYSVPFTSLIMHATVSETEQSYCYSIYLQLEGQEPLSGMEGDACREVRLVPADSTAVHAIFQALCDGAAANPDGDMEDDEGDFFFDQAEVAQGAAEADDESHSNLLSRFEAMLQHPSNGVLPNDHEQFEDAIDSDDDGIPEERDPSQPGR